LKTRLMCSFILVCWNCLSPLIAHSYFTTYSMVASSLNRSHFLDMSNQFSLGQQNLRKQQNFFLSIPKNIPNYRPIYPKSQWKRQNIANSRALLPIPNASAKIK
jgi:hypothetical protein